MRLKMIGNEVLIWIRVRMPRAYRMGKAVRVTRGLVGQRVWRGIEGKALVQGRVQPPVCISGLTGELVGHRVCGLHDVYRSIEIWVLAVQEEAIGIDKQTDQSAIYRSGYIY